MNDESSLHNMLQEDEWHIGSKYDKMEGKHYCPKCFEFNDEDEFILKPAPLATT